MYSKLILFGALFLTLNLVNPAFSQTDEKAVIITTTQGEIVLGFFPNAFFDISGSIGKRYRRMDEIGCPCCITIDHQTLKDETVTVRNRDNAKQERVKLKELMKYLMKKLYNCEYK